MSISSWITFQVSENCSQNELLMQFLDSSERTGWLLNDVNNNKTYLPLGDNDDFDWCCENITRENMIQIFQKKIELNEIVGLGITKHPQNISCNVLVRSDNTVSCSLMGNRKTIFGAQTDVNWYLSEFMQIWSLTEATVESLEFTETYC